MVYHLLGWFSIHLFLLLQPLFVRLVSLHSCPQLPVSLHPRGRVIFLVWFPPSHNSHFVHNDHRQSTRNKYKYFMNLFRSIGILWCTLQNVSSIYWVLINYMSVFEQFCSFANIALSFMWMRQDNCYYINSWVQVTNQNSKIFPICSKSQFPQFLHVLF